MNEFEPEIEQIALIPSEGGRYEIQVNGSPIFNKQKSGRHPRTGEIVELVRKYLKEQTT
ncbi:MAG: Rdx family protein [Anaerolineaceae bacterium]|nr:Rdx family protein [Anaerolineaceae bacterium]